MKILSGLFLIVLSLIGTIFFRRYSGAVILHPTLWYLLFIALGILGFLLVRSRLHFGEKLIAQAENSRRTAIRKNAEKIELDFDSCEFNSGSYYHEVNDDNVDTINILAPGGFSHDATKMERVNQSSLIYHYTIAGKSEKYIGSFPFDSTSVKAYVLQNKICLYIDRFDRNSYFFELES